MRQLISEVSHAYWSEKSVLSSKYFVMAERKKGQGEWK
jgi:hypothetical protein